MTRNVGGRDMPSIRRRGASLYYEDRGSGHPPMVFIHGIGKHDHFARQIEHFERTHRVIAPDLPGFGASEEPPGRRCGIADFADDVAWLCDELALDAPVIVGHSMGGAVGFETAAARPQLVSAVVLLDPIPIVPLPALRDQRAALLGALEGPHYADALRSFAESRMFRPTDDPEIRVIIVDDMCATSQPVLSSVFSSVNEWSGERIAGELRCPVLLISAGDGLPADLERTRELLSPRLELGRTVGAGHFAHVLAPAQVNAMIDQFLAVIASTNC